MRRLIPSPRWFVLLLVALATAALFVRLGIWQLHRLEERRDFNAAIALAQREPAAPLTRGSGEYLRVEATGRYVPEQEIVLYGRSLEGERGNHVLTPLLDENGRALIVDRGWVPFHLDEPPVEEAAPPEGTVRVVGVLFPFERDTPRPEGDPSDVMAFLDRGRIAAAVDEPLHPLYLRLQSQEPGQESGLPREVPLPEPTEGPHLSYAIQWFSFAIIALAGYTILAVRTSRRSLPAGAPGGDR